MIITNKDNIPDDVALMLVLKVVDGGKVSHDSKGNSFYCWCTVFQHNGEEIAVWTRRNLNQPSFLVCKHKGGLTKNDTKMTFYHGTSRENWEKIQEEGILFGIREAEGCHPSRCTYLAVDLAEAKHYGDTVLKVSYDPFKHKKMNNYENGCWQVRVYEPIPLSDVEILTDNNES